MTGKLISKFFFFVVFICSALPLKAQLINHYWTQNFNSTSSLIGGAVVAGDGENSSIYYNPATIVEMEQGSNVSLAANLFSWNVYRNFNALGEGNNLYNTNFQVQPQFVSFTYKPPKGNVSYAFSVLTRIKEDLETDFASSKDYDVMPYYPGKEMYNSLFSYRNQYSDTWVGFGLGQKLNNGFSYGVTLFVSASGLTYHFGYSNTAYKFADSTYTQYDHSSIAQSTYEESIKFYQYRIISKLGLAYKHDKWRFGLVLTVPSVNVFSSGRTASRSQLQSNIRNQEGQLVSEYLIFSVQEKKQLTANYKYPFAASFGFIREFREGDQKLYFTMEYFNEIKPYTMVGAEVNPDITSPQVYDTMQNKDYLSFAYKADPIVNFAIGYSWKIKETLTFLNAFRTDFASVQNLSTADLNGYNFMKTAFYNIYHYSAGLNFTFKKNTFIAGGEFSFGYTGNQNQIANFNNPVEYNPATGVALQGPQQNSAYLRYYGVSIYISATLNFISKKDKE